MSNAAGLFIPLQDLVDIVAVQLDLINEDWIITKIDYSCNNFTYLYIEKPA